MPQAAIVFVANFLVGVGVGATLATFVATVFVYAATAAALNAASRALTPKRKGAGLGSGAEINYFDTGAGIRLVYGRMRVGGMETIPPLTSGTNNRELNKLLTLAGHEVDSFNSVYFDSTLINQVDIGPNNNTFVNSDGLVISGTYSGHAYIRQYRGNSLTPRFDLRMSLLNLDGNANNISTCALTLIFNQSVYPGVPTFTFTLQGKRVYDPRLDVSPGASPTNAAYIAWSACPALCLADYLMSSLGGGYDADEIDWTTVVTAANYCDVQVNVPGPTTLPRYTCNGVVLATEKFIDNVKALVDSMLGRIIFRDGKWRVYAGSWQTPTFTIPKNAWVGPLTFRMEQGREKRFNKMHCFYVDAARDFQRVECLPQSDTGYLSADGEALEAETEQLLCTNEYEAQRKARFLLRQSRNQISVAGSLPPAYQDIALWDTGTIVFDFFGWSSKTFRASSISLRPDGALDAVFTEEQSGDWTDLDAADYNTQSVTAFPTANATTPSEPTSLSAVEQINGTILFTIGTPIIRPPGSRFQIIRSTNSVDASVGTVVYEGIESPINLVMPTSRHWYYARSICNSLTSAYQPNTFGLSIATFPIAENRFAGQLITDPEFMFSSENGKFWIHSATAIFSLTLDGLPGAAGGSVRYLTPSLGVAGFNADKMFALPNTPFLRNTDPPRGLNCQMRVRPLFTLPGNRRFTVYVYPWTGTPTLTGSTIDNGRQAQMFIDISTGGILPSSGSFVMRSGSSSVVASNVNSFPFLIAALVGPINGDVSSAVTGEAYEIDCIYVNPIT